jgi:hypothetical protein
MTFDFEHLSESKAAHRRKLAALPIGEKLRLLDAMRERELAIRGRAKIPGNPSGILCEEPSPYRPGPA